ncbi:hypothetical protein [Desulfobotulus mexicanus]|uniref:HEAT repeat domain-containing protein n=1 Tax=Desulfobotulus mexicanus TaxID=2586642 RepID=A0A5S5MEP3_9BACT|nr:hypothetical protein [Desulfobotulus mexicanus]TYT74191.1 hypothetical protein FIM25_11445 [Desulfobotulus mexicanus]
MEAEVKILVNDKVFVLNYEDVSEYLVDFIPDRPEAAKVFSELAYYPIPSVRECMAEKENIDDETIRVLLGDSQVSVLRKLVNHHMQRLEKEDVLRLLQTGDATIQESIAYDLRKFEEPERLVYAEYLCKSDNLIVRGILAENRHIPEEVLEILLNDRNPDVAKKAEVTLRRIEKRNKAFLYNLASELDNLSDNDDWDDEDDEWGDD